MIGSIKPEHLQAYDRELFDEHLPLAEQVARWFCSRFGYAVSKLGGCDEILQIARIALFAAVLGFPAFERSHPGTIFRAYSWVVIRRQLMLLFRAYRRWGHEVNVVDVDRRATVPSFENIIIDEEHRRAQLERLKTTCLTCGKAFFRVNRMHHACSRACGKAPLDAERRKAERQRTAAARAGKHCVRCGSSFEAKRSDKKYCGLVCRNKAAEGNTQKVTEGRARRLAREAAKEQTRASVLQLAQEGLSTRAIAKRIPSVGKTCVARWILATRSELQASAVE